MKTFRLTVASPDGNLFDGDVVKLDVRGTEGELAIMAGHVPFVTSVVKGGCAVWTDDDTKRAATIDGGLLSVASDSVTLLAGSFRFEEE